MFKIEFIILQHLQSTDTIYTLNTFIYDNPSPLHGVYDEYSSSVPVSISR